MAKSRKIPIADPESSTDESDSEPTPGVPPVTKPAAVDSSSSEEDSDESDSAQPTSVPLVKKPRTPVPSVTKQPTPVPPVYKQRTPVPSVTKAAVAESSSEEEDSDESETELEPESEPSAVAATPAPQRPVAEAAAADSSSEEDSDESEPETESESEQVKKNSEKPSSPAVAKTSASVGVKRPSTLTLDAASATKRSKGEGGKGAFVRVFSNEDEIILLKGLEAKEHPSKEEMDQYCESMMGKLSVSVTKAQIQDKLKRLKNKFFSNREKAANSNKGKSFSDAHESVVYHISEKVWGKEKGPKPRGGGTAQKSSKKADVVEEKKEGGHVNYVAGGKSTKEWAYGEGMELLDEDAKMELQSEWKQLRKEELGFKVRNLEQKLGFKARRIELKRKQLNMLRNAF